MKGVDLLCLERVGAVGWCLLLALCCCLCAWQCTYDGLAFGCSSSSLSLLPTCGVQEDQGACAQLATASPRSSRRILLAGALRYNCYYYPTRLQLSRPAVRGRLCLK
jgi:hypothetical protein